MSQHRMIKIVVGGIRFATRPETLRTHPNTLLASLDQTSEFYDSTADEFVFDRDPQVFPSILSYYRTSELHLPAGICGNAIRTELRFWQISESLVSECCWRVMHQVDQDEFLYNNLKQTVQIESTQHPAKYETDRLCYVRHKLYLILEKPNSCKAAKIWNTFYLSVVFLSSLLLTLSSLPDLHSKKTMLDKDHPAISNFNNTKLDRTFYRLLDEPFIIEKIMVIFFTVEITIRFLVHEKKKRFFLSVLNWVDMIATASGLGTSVIDLWFRGPQYSGRSGVFWSYFILHCLMVFRLLRLFRLQERYHGLKIIFLTIQKCAADLILLLLYFLILSTIFGTLEYYCEYSNGKFYTIPLSIYWSIITMTTVGYGDFYPETACGYIFGTMCAMCGVIFLSIPIALIAATFNEYYKRNQQRELALKKKKIACKTTIFPLNFFGECFTNPARLLVSPTSISPLEAEKSESEQKHVVIDTEVVKSKQSIKQHSRLSRSKSRHSLQSKSTVTLRDSSSHQYIKDSESKLEITHSGEVE